jgi:signal transduction histidine kinase
MEAVGQLTGGLAHDFNNLLTGIIGNLELLGIRLAQGRIKDLDRYVAAAQGAATRAAALTPRLLAFSRRQMLEAKPTDINRLVAGMEELIAAPWDRNRSRGDGTSCASTWSTRTSQRARC